jgi:hypothetical protein
VYELPGVTLWRWGEGLMLVAGYMTTLCQAKNDLLMTHHSAQE